MKLLDFTTDEAADVLCTISPLIENIVKDGELTAVLKQEVNAKDMTRIEATFALAERLFTSTPILFGPHKNDIFGILAALNKKSVSEIAKQTLRETKDQIKEMFSDEELINFFTSFRRQGVKEQSTQSA